MDFDLEKASQIARGEITALDKDRALSNVEHSNAFHIVCLARAGLPHRALSVAYVLGVVAGVEFEVHGELPGGSIFKNDTPQKRDYAQGFMDAALISEKVRERRRPAEFVDVFAMIFGGKK